MSNSNINKAKKVKDDELYTRYEDIEEEIKNYKDIFEGKIVYCNCDTLDSNFYKYFKNNFEIFKLKELLITGLGNKGYSYDGKNLKSLNLDNSGKFQENTNILEKCDIVVTNPPFSLFRNFIDILVEYNKDFIVIGSNLSITYYNVLSLFKSNKLFLGFNSPCEFNNNPKKVNTYWYTTFSKNKIPPMKLTKKYSKEEYPMYDNINAIEVSRVKNIPYDYSGLMGVPVSFIAKWNRKQFDLLGITASWDNFYRELSNGGNNLLLNGNKKFKDYL